MPYRHPLSEVSLYIRVIELGSIRAAAREAGLEPSSLSRKLNNLEHRLKTKLLDRSQGKTVPTDAGERYYQKMRLLLPQLEEIETEISGESTEPKGLLKVNASIDFGQRHVTQWLLEFRKQYPLVEVQLTLASQFVDIVSEGIDLAIRVGKLKDANLKAKKIAEVPRVLVASPAYLEKHGTPSQVQELAAHQHVFFSAPTRNTPMTIVDEHGTSHSIPRQGKVSINAVASVVEAVKMGEGIHLGPRWAFEQEIQLGSVVELFPECQFPALPMHAIWSPAAIMPARLRLFIDFISQQAPKVPGLMAV